MSSPTEVHRVLVMGYRQGLCDALARQGVPHAVWSEAPLKSKRDLLHLHVEKFPRSDPRICRVLSELTGFGPFTQVIAGTEAAVYSAAVARRFLAARTSSKSVALRCHDKLHMKSYLQQHEVPMTAFMAGDDIQDARTVFRRLGKPVVVKARHESGGRGMRLVETPADLIRFAGRNTILERLVSAPEASVESFIDRGEILFENVTQYYVKQHVNVVPGDMSPVLQQRILDLNRAVVRALRIEWGMTHMEAYLTDEGVLFGEIALRPPGGYIMELISEAYGFSSWDALVHVELGLPFAFPAGASGCAAVLVIHPGAGTVSAIHNWDQVLATPSVYRARARIKPGAVLGDRKGVGEDAGYVLLSNPNRDGLMADLAHVRDTLDIVMDPPAGAAD